MINYKPVLKTIITDERFPCLNGSWIDDMGVESQGGPGVSSQIFE